MLEDAAQTMNLLPEVHWDRCVPAGPGEWAMTVYGWIDREDGRSDFVELWFDVRKGAEVWSFSTSSARYSAEFARRLFGDDIEHNDCQRIEDVFGDLVKNKIKL